MAIYRLPNFVRALLVIGLFAALLGACAPQERQEINFVFMRTSDQTEPYWQEVIRAFEAENPNIKVNLFIFTWDEGRQKIQEMIDQGNPPTLARVATRWIPEYVAAGLLEPVDHYMTPDFRAQFIPLLINEGSQYEGRTFGLPITVSSRAFYYNEDLFKQAGVASPPTNWDELYEAAQTIHKLGPRHLWVWRSREGPRNFDLFLLLPVGQWGRDPDGGWHAPGVQRRGGTGSDHLHHSNDQRGTHPAQPNPKQPRRP
ncbi:MAG: extracellular solute-binding protein [Chloroflexi bacterium]|nr:extracellular solute-binding protein [Chloroflexota bacterium]